ncbi:MAG: TRAP transporter fused permease subunit [Halofilum sp. (in: g-proteobacteria)]|nr:TRAP transporter fused permease subunit [Halofilum sp. (in: g-proteobacteria)]
MSTSADSTDSDSAGVPAGDPRWAGVALGIDVVFWILGAGLTAYLAGAALGFSPDSAQHYSNFALVVLVMAGVLAVRNLVYSRRDGLPVRAFWPRLAVALIALVTTAVSFGYIRWHATRLETAQPFFEGFDLVIGFVMIFSVLVLNWLHWGWLLTTVIGAAIAYFFFGHNIDSVLFMVPEYDTNFVLNYMGLGTTQGFFWLVQLATDSIYFLVIYASVLLGVRTVEMVLEVGKACGRHVHGGAAMAPLFGSGVIGAVMGQAVSNVVLTGRFTIPMMKHYGYRAPMAGAIEATASTAGQILPPILGLSGFIIASMIGVPYIEVALSSLIPGLLYLSGSLIAVLVYARRMSLPKLTERVNYGVIRRVAPTFVISFVVVVWLLLGYRSPSYAGLFGIAIALGLCLFQGRYRPRLPALLRALDEGLVLVTVLSVLLIAIGALAQTVLTTGLSGRLGSVLIAYLPDSQLLMLLGAMLVSLVLGLGLPTPAAYLVASLAMVPFLQQAGIPDLQAHFFVFYFAVFSTLTPPVMVSILAAARLAHAGLRETVVHALKIACTTFIVPFAFVYNPSLMSFPDIGWDIVLPLVEVLTIQVGVAVSAFGYLLRPLAVWERTAFGLVALLGFVTMTQDPVLWYALTYGLLACLATWVIVPRFLTATAAPCR